MQEIWRITRYLITGTLLSAVVLSGLLLFIADTQPSPAGAEHFARRQISD